MTVNVKDLAAKVAAQLGKEQKDVQNVVESTFSTILEMSKHDHDISIHNFGKFKLVNKAERVGRNPKTGESVKIPAKTSLKFTLAKPAKQALNS